MLSDQQRAEIAELSSLGLLLMTCIKYKDLNRQNLESKIEEKVSEVKHNLERNLTMLEHWQQSHFNRFAWNCYGYDYCIYWFN